MSEQGRHEMLDEWKKMRDGASMLRAEAHRMIGEAEALEDAFASKWAPLKWGDEILIRKSSWGKKTAKKYRAKVIAITESFVSVLDDRIVPCWEVRATNDAGWDFYARYNIDKNGEYGIEFAEKKGRKA